jgi:hypothetical protein
MNTGTDLKQTAEAALPRPVLNLRPKRRTKPVCETARIVEARPVSTVPGPSRRPRLKRSGQMLIQWRSGAEHPNIARISPEILSAFNHAIGALATSPAKQPAHALA